MSEQTNDARPAKREPLTARIKARFLAQPALQAAVFFVFALVVLVVVGWFILFSGLSTSADFVYNQF